MPKVDLSKTLLLTAGAAIGALLFAPKSGKELRKDLKEEAGRLGDKAKVYADNLKTDVNEAYHEAKHQVEYEREVMAQQEAELQRTIAEIEQELEERDYDNKGANPNEDLGNVHGTPLEPTVDQGSLSDVPDNVLEETDLGDVHQTTQEPGHDQGSLDNVPDQVLEETDLGNVHGTSQEPNQDQVVPSDELDEALEDVNLEDNDDFDVKQ